MTSDNNNTRPNAPSDVPTADSAPPNADHSGSKMGLYRRVAKNSGMIFLSKGLGTFSSVAYLVLAARGLGATDLGIVILTHSFMALITQIMAFKSSEVLIKYGAGYVHEKKFEKFQRLVKLTLSLDLASGFLGALVGIALMHILGTQFGLPDEAIWLASLYCMVILLNVSATPNGILRLFNRFDLIAYQLQVEPVTRLIGTAAAYYVGAPWQTYLLVWFLSRVAHSITLMIISWYELRRQNLLRIFTFDLRHLASPHPGIWWFSWSSNLHGTVSLIGTHLATLIVSVVLGPAGAALFKVAQEIVGVVGNASQFFNSALYPELVKLTGKSAGRDMERIIHRVGGGGFLVGVVFTALMAIGGKIILSQLFGAEFVGAFTVLLLLCVAATIELATFAYESALYVAGRPQFALYLKALSSIVQIIAMFVLLDLIGLNGAGYAAILANILGALLLVIVTKRVIRRLAAP